MTEGEAKTKWCPFVRVGGPMQSEAEGTTANRWPGDDPVRSDSPYRCLGSACMAWRVSMQGRAAKVERGETGTTIPRVKIKPPEGDGWVAVQAGRDRPDRAGQPPYRWIVWERQIAAIPDQGFCGLAGAPQ